MYTNYLNYIVMNLHSIFSIGCYLVALIFTCSLSLVLINSATPETVMTNKLHLIVIQNKWIKISGFILLIFLICFALIPAPNAANIYSGFLYDKNDSSNAIIANPNKITLTWKDQDGKEKRA